jgi:glyoxylase-like metal-dependent hydrolase (beta-lactamase superfamily II)
VEEKMTTPKNKPTPETTPLSRRQALGIAVAGGVGMSALSLSAAAQTTTSTAGVGAPGWYLNMARTISAEMVKVAPNAFAYIQREAKGESNVSVSNCGLIVGPKSLFAIDATAAPVHAKRFRAMAEKATGKKIDRVVLTHMHGDHRFGLQFLGDIEVIAQEACAAAMALGPSSRPLFWDGSNPAWANGKDQFRAVTATTIYKDKLTYMNYGSEIQLIWPGQAHTLGDTLVYLPKEKVIFIGDIGFFGLTPLNGSGYLARWIKVCDEILAMDVDVIVPGHGPVGGKRELAEMKGYLALVYDEARKRFDRGMTAGRAAAEIDLGQYAAWADADRIVPNVVRVYSEFTGTISEAMSMDALAVARADFAAARAGR